MSYYIRYVIENIEPLRIADDSISQSGQAVSFRYIPGSTMRGYIINQLARLEEFEEKKIELFSAKTKFLNAYPYIDGMELMPSPKGFYEDKKEEEVKNIQNVVIDGQFEEGLKRANLGRFCAIENDCIYYYNVTVGSDMKIKIGAMAEKNDKEQSVFRNEYICKGNKFVGYISVETKLLAEKIQNVMRKKVRLGNARSQGYGLCRIVEQNITEEIPYEKYIVKDDIEKECYMMLLSNTVMRSEFGEYEGINLKELEKELGVTKLEIKYASTSVVDVRGYNREWRNKIPSVPMYEQGSMFHLKFEGKIDIKAAQTVMDQGIGIRKNEGFGRILFLRNYEKITKKKEIVPKAKEYNMDFDKLPIEDKKQLHMIAANYYRKLLEKKIRERILSGVDKKGISASQLGNVLSILTQFKYEPKTCKKTLDDYFIHALEKEAGMKQQSAKASLVSIKNKISSITGKSLEQVLDVEENRKIMGIAVKDLAIEESEKERMKIEYLILLIKNDMERTSQRTEEN